MKKVFSVFGLLSRNTIYKIFTVFVVLGAVESVWFWKKMKEQLALQNQLELAGVGGGSLEYLVNSSHLFGWYTLAFVLITVFLAFSTCNWGSVQGYTLKRLRVSEWEIFWIQSVYNFLCYVLLMGVQLGFLFVIGYFYRMQYADTTNQTMFLAFYRNAFMHSILPLEEWPRLLINLLMYGGMAVTAASVPYFQRNKKFGWEAIVVMGILAVGFEAELGSAVPYVLALIVVSLTVHVIPRVYLLCLEPIRANWIDYVATQENMKE